MSLSPSNRDYSTKGRIRQLEIIDPVVAIAIVIVFYLYRMSFISDSILSVLLLLLINTIIVFRRYMELYNVTSMFLGLVLLYLVLKIVQLGDLCFVVDSMLCLLILILVSSYRYVDTLREVFARSIPFVILVSTMIGVYLGVDHPLRYLLLTIIDVFSSSMLYVAMRKEPVTYIYSVLNAIVFFTSPIISIDISTLLVFVLLHVSRNTFMFSENPKRRRYSGFMLGIDLMLKPLVVKFI